MSEDKHTPEPWTHGDSGGAYCVGEIGALVHPRSTTRGAKTMDRMTHEDVEYLERHTFDGDIDTQGIELEQDLAMLDDAALED